MTFLNHFRHYLLGAPLTIRTDHGALGCNTSSLLNAHSLDGWKNYKNTSLLSFIDLGINIAMQMLYLEFLVSNVEEVTPNQLQPSPLQTPLVVLPCKRCVHFNWMTNHREVTKSERDQSEANRCVCDQIWENRPYCHN